MPFLTFLAWERIVSAVYLPLERSLTAGPVSHLQDHFPSSAAAIKCFVLEQGVPFPTPFTAEVRGRCRAPLPATCRHTPPSKHLGANP